MCLFSTDHATSLNHLLYYTDLRITAIHNEASTCFTPRHEKTIATSAAGHSLFVIRCAFTVHFRLQVSSLDLLVTNRTATLTMFHILAALFYHPPCFFPLRIELFSLLKQLLAIVYI